MQSPSKLGQKGHIGYINNIKVDARNTIYSMTFSSKPRNQNFIVFLNEVQAAITGHEAVIFLPFLMNCTLTHFRIVEFGCLASTPTFSSRIPLHMRCTSERIGLQGCAQVGFLVLLIMSLLVPSVTVELPGSMETTALATVQQLCGDGCTLWHV
ncbi:hypothetical protein NN561_006411 [Cricetulus griseus]